MIRRCMAKTSCWAFQDLLGRYLWLRWSWKWPNFCRSLNFRQVIVHSLKSILNRKRETRPTQQTFDCITYIYYQLNLSVWIKLYNYQSNQWVLTSFPIDLFLRIRKVFSAFSHSPFNFANILSFVSVSSMFTTEFAN